MMESKDLSRNSRQNSQSQSRQKSNTWLEIAGQVCVFCLLVILLAPCMQAQGSGQTKIVPCPAPGQDLNVIPQIEHDGQGHLKAVLILSDNGNRVLWDAGSSRCATQPMRFFSGYAGTTLKSAPPNDLFQGTLPLPGPTLRARVGNLVEITFVNRINTSQFANSLDKGEAGTTGSCDVVNSSSAKSGGNFPNCLHGSSTANVHFHGTHTTPNTTGDNVLLFVRPSMGGPGKWEPTDKQINTNFQKFFTETCEKEGSPSHWSQMPSGPDGWQEIQKALVKKYDDTTSYKGNPPPLPAEAQLSPVNNKEITLGLWPQYQIGAFPYCFRLPTLLLGGQKYKMYQAPGTHWYHAHKHGSTALNVANGMTGAFIIEGKYDDELRAFYKKPTWDFQEKVLVIQQLTTTLNLTNPLGTAPNSLPVPVLSVNGGRSPVIKMRPNQVQIWRFVNGAERDAARLLYFVSRGQTGSCESNPNQCVTWHQIAQDGVQFKYTNYAAIPLNNDLNMAPGNRADLLVKAPPSGTYDLKVQAGLCEEGCNPQTETLLTVEVKEDPGRPGISPPMPFIGEQGYPEFPDFLSDIPADSIFTRRDIAFQDKNFKLVINGKQFEDNVINQAMLLNSLEEWKISNLDDDREHPFHIHVNPFQIIEVFRPTSAEASDKNNKECYADPTNPETWKQCHPPKQDFIWWDVFAIPKSRVEKLSCTTLDACPAQVRQYTTCSNNVCNVTIPGYFRMRSRFADFPGQFVLHCHILTHEDRGMMELIEIVPNTTDYSHH
jgi:FtsP/CotA-like multicopper oxidase with cupredoxin domain